MSDPFLRIKSVGYCRAFLPSKETLEMEDFLRVAKFSLCKLSNTLWKDPIWDTYTDEDLMVEYYSHLYSSDKDAKEEFESVAGFSDYEKDSLYNWLLEQAAEEEKMFEKRDENLEDVVSLNPSELGI